MQVEQLSTIEEVKRLPVTKADEAENNALSELMQYSGYFHDKRCKDTKTHEYIIAKTLSPIHAKKRVMLR